jgi:hypothetical protein
LLEVDAPVLEVGVPAGLLPPPPPHPIKSAVIAAIESVVNVFIINSFNNNQ